MGKKASVVFLRVVVNVAHTLPTAQKGESKKGLDCSRPLYYLAPRPGLEPGTYGLTEAHGHIFMCSDAKSFVEIFNKFLHLRFSIGMMRRNV